MHTVIQLLASVLLCPLEDGPSHVVFNVNLKERIMRIGYWGIHDDN